MIGKIALMLFPLMMAFAASSDLFTMRISNRVVLILAAGFVPLALMSGMAPEAIGMHLLCGVLVLVVAFCLFSRGWIGGGDAKFAAATALWLGFGDPGTADSPTGVLPYLVYASLIGGVMAVGLLSVRRWALPGFLMKHDWVVRLHDARTGIPYGIALAIAGLMTYSGTTIFQRLVS
jgi:prepilin peptidase CpaA